ncbi:hypothetical protein [Streptomyces sp. NPDC090445]|uniref:hypothetical protein n=1 Tax=Streptomyces sp. NPDC090445 TaxID=3365963 RepID=UPI00382B333A
MSVSIARLHGEACYDCGAVLGDLIPAGEVTHPDSGRVWPIRKCGDHVTGWCSWHSGPATSALRVVVAAANSGPGIRTFACETCREQRDRMPIEDAQ